VEHHHYHYKVKRHHHDHGPCDAHYGGGPARYERYERWERGYEHADYRYDD
jgi:hypothetical protein